MNPSPPARLQVCKYAAFWAPSLRALNRLSQSRWLLLDRASVPTAHWPPAQQATPLDHASLRRKIDEATKSDVYKSQVSLPNGAAA